MWFVAPKSAYQLVSTSLEDVTVSYFKSIEIHIKFGITPKIMKLVSKFELGLPLSWQTLVAPGHQHFARVIVSFPYG
jgi:hypothetical protein